MIDDDDEIPDEAPGVAGERTTLAWRRTGLSVALAGIAIARGVPVVKGVPGRPAVGVLVLVLGAVVFLISHRQSVRRTAGSSGRQTAELADLAPVAVGTTLVAIAAFLVVVLR